MVLLRSISFYFYFVFLITTPTQLTRSMGPVDDTLPSRSNKFPVAPEPAPAPPAPPASPSIPSSLSEGGQSVSMNEFRGNFPAPPMAHFGELMKTDFGNFNQGMAPVMPPIMPVFPPPLMPMFPNPLPFGRGILPSMRPPIMPPFFLPTPEVLPSWSGMEFTHQEQQQMPQFSGNWHNQVVDNKKEMEHFFENVLSSSIFHHSTDNSVESSTWCSTSSDGPNEENGALLEVDIQEERQQKEEETETFGVGFDSWITSLFGGGGEDESSAVTSGSGFMTEIDEASSWSGLLDMFTGDGSYIERILIDIESIFPEDWEVLYADIPTETRSCIIENYFMVWKKKERFSKGEDMVHELERNCAKGWQEVRSMYTTMKADFDKLTKPLQDIIIEVWTLLLRGHFQNTHAVVKEYYAKWNELSETDLEVLVEIFPKLKLLLELPYASILAEDLEKYGKTELKGLTGLLEVLQHFEDNLEKKRPGVFSVKLTCRFGRAMRTDILVVIKVTGKAAAKGVLTKIGSSPVTSFFKKTFHFGSS